MTGVYERVLEFRATPIIRHGVATMHFCLAVLVSTIVMYERGRACEYAAPSQSLRRIIISCVLTRIGIGNNSNTR